MVINPQRLSLQRIVDCLLLLYMNLKINKKSLIILVLILSINISFGQTTSDNIDTSMSNIDPILATKSMELVRNFATLFYQGNDINKLLDLCSVPFVIDGEEIISGKSELGKKFTESIDIVGKNRQIDIDSVYIYGSRKEILNDLIPVDVYFIVLVLKIKNGKDVFEKNGGFAVQIADDLKIIGFGR